MIRTYIARLFLRAGMAIMPSDVREMMRDIVMYNVPGALTEKRKQEIRDAKRASEQKIHV